MNPIRSGWLLALALFGCASTPDGLEPPQWPDAARQAPEHYLLVLVDNVPGPVSMRAGSTPRGYDRSAHYVASSAARATARALAREFGLEEVGAWTIVELRAHCIMYRITDGTSREVMLGRLAADGRVQLAQPLQAFETSSAAYDDPYLDLQRGFAQMSIEAAHRWSQGSGVTVAIIDTGIDTGHPDLDGRIDSSRDFVAASARGPSAERHGTAVAGVIAAVGNNGQGIVGIAPGARLLALRACWATGQSGDRGTCNSFTLALALAAAVEAGADVINLSLVGPADPLLEALLRRAIERGAIVVGAVPTAGRIGGFPSAVGGVLPVAMAEQWPQDPHALLAPGRDVLTLAPEGHYDFSSGHSLATAHVSGVVALLRARRPKATASDLHELLTRSMQATTTRVDAVAAIDACAALSTLLTVTGCPRPPSGGAARLHHATHSPPASGQKNP